MRPLKKVKMLVVIVTILLSVLFKSPAVGLIFGLIIAIFYKNPENEFTSKLSKYILQLAVILLGFQLQIGTVLSVGKSSLFITAASLFIVLFAGFWLGKLFKLDKKISTLISGGTAICGGSAIAAIAPAINANQSQIGVSMGIVFLLNAIALFVFPPIGHMLHLTQNQFGLWAAIAIHDTSSVVGATVSYGAQAAAIGTTVKLVRALWILPVSFIFAKMHKSQSNAKFPLFLIGFILASIIRTIVPQFDSVWDIFALSGKHLMVGTLFLIGLNLSPKAIKDIGCKPLVAAVLLWFTIGVVSLAMILLTKGITLI